MFVKTSPMEPRFETVTAKTAVGIRMEMNFADNRTGELWRTFVPRRDEVKSAIGNENISAQVYKDVNFFKLFDPLKSFDKWAARHVSDPVDIPVGMEVLLIPAGLYAVFHYKGSPADASDFFRAIFGTWMPQSAYELDDRPHFEILGDKYKNNDPESEEDVYIPIRLKKSNMPEEGTKIGEVRMGSIENDITVFYTKADSFPEGIMDAHQRMHSEIEKVPGRRYFGMSRPEGGIIEYKAAAEKLPFDARHDLPELTIVKGKYVVQLIADYMLNPDSIGEVFQELLKRNDLDTKGYCVEHYINERDVECMIRLAD